ncbi:MAG: glycosyl hydrolase family 28 protein [Clostridiaceae bacterium]|nr:glycosyl hydrolase family 28 protein [Clostridiaceae bacterium]
MNVFWQNSKLLVKKSTVFPAPYLHKKQTDFVIFRYLSDGLLTVVYEQEPQSVLVRPLSLGIRPELDKNKVTVRLDRPCNFSVEINGGTDDALLVFAGGADQVDRAGYEHMIYFPAGGQNAGIIEIGQDNTLIYLEEGAHVHGKILAENKRHLALAGLGVLSMENYEHDRKQWQHALDFRFCSDLTIENITVTDSCSWSCRVFGCENVHIANLKIIGQRGNSDGIDICGSRDILVEGCFTRVWDDSLVVKAFDTGDMTRAVFRNCVLWNDFARPIEVGVELRADKVHDIRFENIDILHSPTGYPLMGIHHGDRADVSDIHFENIRIEDTPGAQLFDIRITDSVWNTDQAKGGIHDIYFKNIAVLEPMPVSFAKSRIQGYNAKTMVKNVTLDNIRLNGCAARNAEECGLEVMDDVDGVRFIAAEGPFIELVRAKLEPFGEILERADGMTERLFRLRLTNTGAAPRTLSCQFKLSPSGRAYCEPSDLTLILAGQETISQDLRVICPPGKFCLHVESSDPGLATDWQFFESDLKLGREIDRAPILSAVNCRREKAGDLQLACRDGSLIIRSESLKGSGIVLYTAKPVPTAMGQVVFSVEETDNGLAPAIINGRHGLEPAPQLRCPAEISYVFKNEPKAEKITRLAIADKINGLSIVPLALLGLEPDTREFWLEIELITDIPKRYPFCLFGSQVPDTICHMFARAVVAEA